MNIKLTNSLAELPRLHAAIESFSRQHAVAADISFKMDLALDEVFTNIVRHGFADALAHEISIRFTCHDECIRIRIEDDGRDFNPLQAPLPDVDMPLEERRPGGLGIFLVRTLMDKIVYRRVRDKNILLLAKKTTRSQE